MKNLRFGALLGASLALLLACNFAQAQFKAKPKSTEPLGSGLYVPPASNLPAADPATTSPDKPDAPLAEDKRSTDEIVEDIAHCLVQNLPQGWSRAQIDVVELARDGKERQFEAKYSYVGADGKEAPFSPCDPRESTTDMYKLNRALKPEKRNWVKATLTITKEGKFELKYDYSKEDAAPDGTAATQKPVGPDAAGKK